MTVDAVAAAIRRHRFRYSSEDQLQQGLAAALAGEFQVRREVRLDARCRIDLMAGRVGIETKVAGTRAELLTQLERYAAFESIDALLVVSNRARHIGLPSQIGGKPLRAVSLIGAGL